MSRYKIGDKVRVLHTYFPRRIKDGEVREVIDVDENGVDLIASDGDSWYFEDWEVELVFATEPTTRTDTLTLTATLDASAVHAELDTIIAKLERIRELREELGLLNNNKGA